MVDHLCPSAVIKIPPFRDAHMHFMLDGRPLTRGKLPGIKETYVRQGIFSVSDMGHTSGIGLHAKALFHGDMEVRSAGYAVYKKGTYGSFLGKGVSGTSEIKKAVHEIADAGADFIKVINSGIVSARKAGSVTDGGFSSEELHVINETARSRNLHMICHANSDAAVLNAINAGAVSIEHGYFLSRETLHRMAEARIAWIPTIFALHSLARLSPAAEQVLIEKTVERQLSSVSYAASIGVILHIGTDSGSKGTAHGSSFFEELQLFRKAGLPPEQIISAACMDEGEMSRGNFLIVNGDFTLEAVFKDKRLQVASPL
ncbi:MAG TPA: amidohydrolase family protein [Dissulfurispiraceae bacterium]|nr:amidohydrolase family protein [Dissulfurispiraceae bacterium]